MREMTRFRRVATAVSLVCLCAFVAPAHAADSAGRTPYERLDLSTPEAAAHAFCEAWSRRDFVTVYAVLSMKAQDASDHSLMVLDPRHLMRPAADVKPLDLLMEGVPPMERWDQKGPDYLFDGLLMAINRHHALPVDFDDATSFGAARLLPDGSAEVIAHSSKMTVPALLHLVQSPSGRWRVELAMEQAGNASELPFGR
jgi:hypothetical protein